MDWARDIYRIAIRNAINSTALYGHCIRILQCHAAYMVQFFPSYIIHSIALIVGSIDGIIAGQRRGDNSSRTPPYTLRII